MESAIHISPKAEAIFHIGEFTVTNSLILSVIILILLVLGAFFLGRRLSLVPGKMQNFFEFVFEGILSLMDAVLGNREKSEKYLPLVATIFLFVLFSNWFGLIPGLNALLVRNESETTPLFRAPSSDLNFTLALAIVTVLAVNLFAMLALGARLHVMKFLNFKSPMGFFVGILELISEFARIISFSFRLFGNVFAGEVLLTITGFLIPYLVPLPFLGLEIFIGFIQAFVFAMLALVFLAVATAEHAEAH